MQRQIALLRGINLGGRRRIAMADLRYVVEARGYGDVRTHLQSGNVVLSTDAPPAAVERDLEHAIREALRVDTRVLVRTRDELAGIVARNPLADVADDPRRYQVNFLAEEPDPRRVDELAAQALGPERFAIDGRELYAWHPNGVQRSVLAKFVADGRLGVVATARNWSTVTRLLELADA